MKRALALLAACSLFGSEGLPRLRGQSYVEVRTGLALKCVWVRRLRRKSQDNQDKPEVKKVLHALSCAKQTS